MAEYTNVLTRTEGRVGLVQINRPQVRNALDTPTMAELLDALRAFDADAAVGCIVVTGDDRAFAAGADIAQMAQASPADMLTAPFLGYWDQIRAIATPIVAAVSGWCLGGGCELAMACDIVVASETARFGQPEITLGVIPGAGGTQRLTRIVGKALAMDMVLSGRRLTAAEALQAGLVARVSPPDRYLADALALAADIASRPAFALRVAKEAVNAAYETTLAEGIGLERRLFALLFSTADQREGMAAFLEKREPKWER